MNIASNPFLCVKLLRYSTPCTFDTYIPLSIPNASDYIHVALIESIGKSVRCMLKTNLQQATACDSRAVALRKFIPNMHSMLLPMFLKSVPCIRSDASGVERGIFVSNVHGVAYLASLIGLDPERVANHVHKDTHVALQQIKTVCRDAGILNYELSSAQKRINGSCKVCLCSKRPITTRRILLSHFDKAFNSELQTECAFTLFKVNKLALFVKTETSTRYTEATPI